MLKLYLDDKMDSLIDVLNNSDVIHFDVCQMWKMKRKNPNLIGAQVKGS